MAINEAIQKAGFVVSYVKTLDKGQGSYNQQTANGAVKQDLAISAYKPKKRNLNASSRNKQEAKKRLGFCWSIFG